MLIQSALDLLTPQITALDWVDRYGGVVQTYFDTVPVGDDGDVIINKFPVSCSVNQTDCAQDQRYQDLCPDNSKKSVLFFEVIRGLQNVGDGNRSGGIDRNKRAFIGTARLIGWLNTDKLGVNECNTAAKAIRSIMPILFQDITINDNTSVLDKSLISFEMSAEVVRDLSIFSKYTFENMPQIGLHPFDYFAVDVAIKIVMPVKCDYTFVLGAEATCTDDSKL